MTKLFTQQDLAERWQVTVTTITDWRNQGVLTPVKGLPSIRFTEQHILDLEGVKLDRLSPLERKRLEKEVDDLKLQNVKMKEIISKVVATAARIYVEEA